MKILNKRLASAAAALVFALPMAACDNTAPSNQTRVATTTVDHTAGLGAHAEGKMVTGVQGCIDDMIERGVSPDMAAKTCEDIIIQAMKQNTTTTTVSRNDYVFYVPSPVDGYYPAPIVYVPSPLGLVLWYGAYGSYAHTRVGSPFHTSNTTVINHYNTVTNYPRTVSQDQHRYLQAPVAQRASIAQKMAAPAAATSVGRPGTVGATQGNQATIKSDINSNTTRFGSSAAGKAEAKPAVPAPNTQKFGGSTASTQPAVPAPAKPAGIAAPVVPSTQKFGGSTTATQPVAPAAAAAKPVVSAPVVPGTQKFGGSTGASATGQAAQQEQARAREQQAARAQEQSRAAAAASTRGNTTTFGSGSTGSSSRSTSTSTSTSPGPGGRR